MVSRGTSAEHAGDGTGRPERDPHDGGVGHRRVDARGSTGPTPTSSGSGTPGNRAARPTFSPCTGRIVVHSARGSIAVTGGDVGVELPGGTHHRDGVAQRVHPSRPPGHGRGRHTAGAVAPVSGGHPRRTGERSRGRTGLGRRRTREAHRLSAGVRRSPADRDLTPLLFPLCRRVGTRGRTGSDAHHDRFRSRRTTTENRSRGTQARPGGHRGHAQPTPRGRRLRVAGGRWGAGGHPTVGTVFHVKHECAEPGAGRSDRASLGGAAGLLPRRTGSFPPRPVLPRRARPHAGWARLARFYLAGFCIAGVPR